MGNPFIFAVRFLKEVNVEMKKVKWLSKNEVIEYTILVLVISAVVGIYLGALDFVFQQGFEWVLDQFGSESAVETPVETETTETTVTTDPATPDDSSAAGSEGVEEAAGEESEASEEATSEEATTGTE